MNRFAERIQALGTENAFKIGDDIRRCEAQGMDVIRFNLGEPDFNSAENINERAIEEIRRGNSHYTDPQGILSFREAIARKIEKTRGIEVGPERVVVTSGAKPPISYSMMTYVNPGDEVIYPSPGFPIYESWITFIGAVPVPLHLDEEKYFRFDASDIEKLMTEKTKMIFINSPSNPTGGVLTEADLAGIAEVIRKKADTNIRIFSDEVYETILFDGRQHRSIVSEPGMEERTVLVSGHSKMFAMTGWRLGYAVLPTVEEAAIFRQININIYSCTPPFIQEAGRQALEGPENISIVNNMAREFEKRRNLVVDGLNAIDGINCVKPEGAFYVFPNVAGVCRNIGILDAYDALSGDMRGKTSPSTLFQMFLLYRYGVATLDRKSFGMIGSQGKHFLRISTATKMELLEEGVRRIREAAQDREGFREFFEKGEHLA